MLDDLQRINRYLDQTGRRELTPRQRRRIQHKYRHQSVEAQDRRDQTVRARLFAEVERKQVSAGNAAA